MITLGDGLAALGGLSRIPTKPTAKPPSAPIGGVARPATPPPAKPIGGAAPPPPAPPAAPPAAPAKPVGGAQPVIGGAQPPPPPQLIPTGQRPPTFAPRPTTPTPTRIVSPPPPTKPKPPAAKPPVTSITSPPGVTLPPVPGTLQPPPIATIPTPGGGGSTATSTANADIAGIWGSLGNIINSTVGPLLTGVIDSLKQRLTDVSTSVVSGIKSGLNDVITPVKNALNNVGDSIARTVDGIKSKIGDAVNAVSRGISQLTANIRGFADNIGDSLRQALTDVTIGITNTVNGIGDAIRVAFTSATDSIALWINNLGADIAYAVSTAVSSVKTFFTNAADTIANAINGAISSVSTTYQNVRQSVEDVLNNILTWLKQAYDMLTKLLEGAFKGLQDFLNNTEEALNDNPIIQWLDTFTYDFPSWDAMMHGDLGPMTKKLEEGIPQLPELLKNSLVGKLASAWAEFNMLIQLDFIPRQVAAQAYAQIALKLNPLDLGTATNAVYRGLMSDKAYADNAMIAGLRQDRAELALEANRPLPNPGDIQAAFLRGEITIEKHNDLLRAYGFSDENIRLITSLYMLIPPPSDLIRMAVKEAFSPEIAQKFGQYEDYPKEFTEWAAKQGIDKDWAERYWAAHWDLPSPDMGFEMLHRGIIDDNELKLLLRALDVMPYWRDRLIQLSYNPLTRVDVRRMYKLGVLTEQDVTRSYLDLGYSQENAQRLTEFTKRYSAPEDTSELDNFRDMARSTYSAAYKRKLLSEQEYRTMLTGMGYYIDDANLLIAIDNYSIAASDKLFDTEDYRKQYQKMTLDAYQTGLLNRAEIVPILSDLGYSDDEAAMQLSLIDYQQGLVMRDTIISKVHDQYTDFIIDNARAVELLDVFQFTPDEIDKLFTTWNVERSLRTKRPSMTDLRTFYKAGLLTKEQLLDEFRGLGYEERYISMYGATIT